MAESTSHKRAKQKAAGKKGKTEVPLPGGGRLDARTAIKDVEVERSGDLARLKHAATKLKKSQKKQKVLQVPQKDMKKAREAMLEVGASGTVKNMSGTKCSRVRKQA